MKTLKRLLYITLCLLIVFIASAQSFASSGPIAENEVQTGSDWAKSQIFEASITELSEMLQNGDITSLELCKVYLERIEKFDKSGPVLNSIISINSSALAQAKQLDLELQAGKSRGKLHGIPILIKDNIDVSGFPTTLGKKTDKVLSEDAAAVKKLTEQGAIILGKTNLSTLDNATRYTVSSIIGETRNVYDTSFSAGGSSGGSAVAVSANFAAAALATDTNFSLSYPAALNGVVSFRPTFNLIDYTGCYMINASRDTVAPVTRSVEDSALLLDILSGTADEMPYSSTLDANALKGKTLLVIKELSGYTYNNPNEFKNYSKEVAEIFESTKQKLKEFGAEIKEVSIPKLFTYYNTCRESLSGSANAKAKLLSELKTLLEQNNAEAFIFPAYLSAPLKSGFDKYGDHLSENEVYLNCSGYLASLVGLPAATIPIGNLECGVGIGMQMVALQNEDAKLLSLAFSFEQNFPLRALSDTVPDLYEGAEKDEEEQSPEISSDSKQDKTESEQSPTAPKKSSPLWQKIAVILIIASVLVLCAYIMISGLNREEKGESHKNRNF